LRKLALSANWTNNMNDTVKISINPTEQIIANANAEEVVTDPKGRTIKLKKPGVLAQFRLIEALGDTAQNAVYMGMVMPLIFVSEIDGEAVFPPNTKREVEALIQRLDTDGVNFVAQIVPEKFGKTDAEKDKAALKN
jgi:hypothetical protein